MLKKIIDYCKKEKLELKRNHGGGINIYVAWENKEFEKYLKRLKIIYKTSTDSNFDYRIYSIY